MNKPGPDHDPTPNHNLNPITHPNNKIRYVTLIPTLTLGTVGTVVGHRGDRTVYVFDTFAGWRVSIIEPLSITLSAWRYP